MAPTDSLVNAIKTYCNTASGSNAPLPEIAGVRVEAANIGQVDPGDYGANLATKKLARIELDTTKIKADIAATVADGEARAYTAVANAHLANTRAVKEMIASSPELARHLRVQMATEALAKTNVRVLAGAGVEKVLEFEGHET